MSKEEPSEFMRVVGPFPIRFLIISFVGTIPTIPTASTTEVERGKGTHPQIMQPNRWG